MKGDEDKEQGLRQAVVRVTEKIEAQRLLTPVLGQTLLARQIEGWRQNGVRDLVFLLPRQGTGSLGEALRQAIRAEAVRQPIKIQALTWEKKYSFYQNLVELASALAEKFLLTEAVNLEAGYEFGQLRTWRGGGVLAVSRQKPQRAQGSAQVTAKIATRVSGQLIKDYAYLTGTAVVRREWLASLRERLASEADWLQAWDELAQTGVVKACEFAAGAQLPEIGQKSYLLAVCRRFFAENDISDGRGAETAKIAPTARIKGPVIIEAGAQVGEYCCLEGPIYLGEGVRVGNFANLRPDLYVERGAEIGSYSEIGAAHLEEGEKVGRSV